MKPVRGTRGSAPKPARSNNRGTACAITRAAALCVVLVSRSLAVGAADIHRWVDAHGQTHFGDKPPPGIGAEVVHVRPNVYASPSIERLTAALGAGDEVTLYSAVWCGYCKRAKRYFHANGIAYREYDVETNAKGQRDYQRLGARGVPVILVGDRRLNGFSEESFERIYRAR